MDLIIAIATLCQVPNGVRYNGYDVIEKRTLDCQQYYLDCVDTQKDSVGRDKFPAALKKCIKERKVK